MQAAPNGPVAQPTVGTRKLVARRSAGAGLASRRSSRRRQQRRAEAAPAPSLNVAQLARALDGATASAIWSKLRAGQRGVMVRSIYSNEGRETFDEVGPPLRRRGRLPGDRQPLPDRFRAHPARDRAAGSERPRGAGLRQFRDRPRLPVPGARQRPAVVSEWYRGEIRDSHISGHHARMLTARREMVAVPNFHLSQPPPRPGRSPARFVISRGAKTEAHVIVATSPAAASPGAARPYPTPATARRSSAALAAIASLPPITSRADLARALPAGAARNAVDCALWDLEAKLRAVPVHALAGLRAPHAGDDLLHAEPRHARGDGRQGRAPSRHLPLLKLKLGGAGDAARMAAVRRGAPRCPPGRRRQRGLERRPSCRGLLAVAARRAASS